jgi:hypothetical protein
MKNSGKTMQGHFVVPGLAASENLKPHYVYDTSKHPRNMQENTANTGQQRLPVNDSPAAAVRQKDFINTAFRLELCSRLNCPRALT